MKLHFPHFKYHYNSDHNLVFEGTIQPKRTMPVYKLSIEYRGNLMPKVKIIDPLLVEKPPHFYYKAECLCLYKPENFNWTATKPISNYIVPWTSCWIYFYEVWKETGIWYGIEAEHLNNKEE
jgi:hypothetical protein